MRVRFLPEAHILKNLKHFLYLWRKAKEMNKIQLFLLISFAGLGAVMCIETILSPVNEKEKIENVSIASTIYTLVRIAFTFIIEPLAVLSAIKNNTGSITIAYIILAIVYIKLYSLFKALFEIFQKAIQVIHYEKRAMTEEEIHELATKEKINNFFIKKSKQIFFLFPKLYLWYLVAIALNLIL